LTRAVRILSEVKGVFESRMLRRILGWKRDKVTGVEKDRVTGVQKTA
jgi:hypothetical protein